MCIFIYICYCLEFFTLSLSLPGLFFHVSLLIPVKYTVCCLLYTVDCWSLLPILSHEWHLSFAAGRLFSSPRGCACAFIYIFHHLWNFSDYLCIIAWIFFPFDCWSTLYAIYMYSTRLILEVCFLVYHVHGVTPLLCRPSPALLFCLSYLLSDVCFLIKQQ